jgi:hypothetical protein
MKIVRVLSLVIVALFALKTVHQMAVVYGFTGETGPLLFGAVCVFFVYAAYRRAWGPRRSAAPALETSPWRHPPCWKCAADVTSDVARCPRCKADQHVVTFRRARAFEWIDLPADFPSFDSCIRCLAEKTKPRTFRFIHEPQLGWANVASRLTALCCHRCWYRHVGGVLVGNGVGLITFLGVLARPSHVWDRGIPILRPEVPVALHS